VGIKKEVQLTCFWMVGHRSKVCAEAPFLPSLRCVYHVLAKSSASLASEVSYFGCEGRPGLKYLHQGRNAQE
jgi:hypothetical protein